MIAMSVSSVILAYSINNSMFLVASAGIVLFVASFSIGLGPIPFVLMGELPPHQVIRVSQGKAGRQLTSLTSNSPDPPPPRPLSFVPFGAHAHASANLSALQGVNWSSNFCVGLFFLPLRNWLSDGGRKDGQVFYLFAIASAVGAIVMSKRIPASQA